MEVKGSLGGKRAPKEVILPPASGSSSLSSFDSLQASLLRVNIHIVHETLKIMTKKAHMVSKLPLAITSGPLEGITSSWKKVCNWFERTTSGNTLSPASTMLVKCPLLLKMLATWTASFRFAGTPPVRM